MAGAGESTPYVGEFGVVWWLATERTNRRPEQQTTIRDALESRPRRRPTANELKAMLSVKRTCLAGRCEEDTQGGHTHRVEPDRPCIVVHRDTSKTVLCIKTNLTHYYT